MSELTKYTVRTFAGTYVDKVIMAESEEQAKALAQWVTVPDDNYLSNIESDMTEVQIADSDDELTPINQADRSYIEKILYKADEGDESIREDLDNLTKAYRAHTNALLGDDYEYKEPSTPMTLMPVAYVSLPDDMWDEVSNNSSYGLVLNVDTVLSIQRDDEISEAEQKIICLCKQAKARGIGDLIVTYD